jgi:hypothetical protein
VLPQQKKKVDLAWNDNSAIETGYRVERSLNAAFSSFTSYSLPANSTTFSQNGLPSGTTYFYRVKATRSAGDSAYSLTVSVTVI